MRKKAYKSEIEFLNDEERVSYTASDGDSARINYFGEKNTTRTELGDKCALINVYSRFVLVL